MQWRNNRYKSGFPCHIYQDVESVTDAFKGETAQSEQLIPLHSKTFTSLPPHRGCVLFRWQHKLLSHRYDMFECKNQQITTFKNTTKVGVLIVCGSIKSWII